MIAILLDYGWRPTSDEFAWQSDVGERWKALKVMIGILDGI